MERIPPNGNIVFPTTPEKTQHVSILLVWLHPSVRKTNLARNHDVNTMVLAKISAVASKPGAAFICLL